MNCRATAVRSAAHPPHPRNRSYDPRATPPAGLGAAGDDGCVWRGDAFLGDAQRLCKHSDIAQMGGDGEQESETGAGSGDEEDGTETEAGV